MSTPHDAQDEKFEFKNPEDNRNKFKKKDWSDNAFQGVSPFDFAMRQKLQEKERKEKERQAQTAMWKYKSADQGLEQQQRKEQFEREKAERNKRMETKSNLKDIKVSQTKEEAEREAQFKREQNEKATRTTTKTNLKDVKITETTETMVRKEQFQREQQSKQVARDQIKKNQDFDMAKSLFGSGGTSGSQDDEEE